MKKLILTACLIVFMIRVSAQSGAPVDSGTFYLHKFAQHIGKESYRIVKSGDSTIYHIDFKFVDRGSPVPLTATLKVNRLLQPLQLVSKGNTSRISKIDDDIKMSGNEAHLRVGDSVYTQKISGLTFPVAGYSPGTVQQVLLQYWQAHHQPASIKMLPVGSVQIKKDGEDTLKFNGRPLLLNRYTASGLIWGNELLWTDKNGLLICLMTNDAEADKLEMMRQAYEELLPELISRAARYSMQLFTKAIPPRNGSDQPVAVVGGNIVDVVNGSIIKNGVVLIEKGLIARIGTRDGVEIPPAARIIDAAGKTVLPGLWDMHAHFEQAEWGPAYLAAGVTTVRDCGNEFDYINAIKTAIDTKKGIGPWILKAGIIDGKGPYALGVVQADTKEEAIEAVDRYKANGFVQIKIYSSVKPAIVKAICDEAHRLGLTVTGHIPNGMNLMQAVDSGMNMVNHVQYVYQVMKSNKEHAVNLDDSISRAAISFIKQHNIVIDPTLGVFEIELRSVKDDITVIEPAFYTLPAPLQAIFKNVGMEAARAQKLKSVYKSFSKIVKALYDAGVPIVAGTDQVFPGYSLDRELELYVAAGLTPIQAIQTATITPAKVMSMDKLYGSLSPGKSGDLIIVDGDPLTNIRDIRKVSVVIKEGQVYDPVQLHRLVGFSK